MSTLRLPATMDSLGTFRSFVIGAIENRTGLESIIDRVDLVLEEVLVNIIHYAYSQEGYIEVECDTSDPETFRITVRDWGVAFNPLERDEPDLAKNISEMQVGGLGVHLVRRMANEVKYERRDGANILGLTFKGNNG